MSGAARCAAGPVEKIRDELLTVARQYQELADRLKRARTAASDPSTMRSAITSVKHIRDDRGDKTNCRQPGKNTDERRHHSLSLAIVLRGARRKVHRSSAPPLTKTRRAWAGVKKEPPPVHARGLGSIGIYQAVALLTGGSHALGEGYERANGRALPD